MARRTDVPRVNDGGRRAARDDYRPTGLDPKPTAGGTLKRTLKEFQEDNLTDWAASLTYYGVLALFPALIAIVSLLGLFGNPATTTHKLTQIVTSLGPKSAGQTLSGPINSLISAHKTAGFALVLGLVGAVWSASGYIGAFTRASNVIYETPEGRPVWKLKPLQLLVTLVMVVLAALVALSLVATGPVVSAIAKPLGLSSTAVTVWNIAKWPVLVLVVLGMISLLYYATPNVRLRGYKFVTPGSIVALVVWVVASALFAFYVANFGSYNKTYGALAGVIIFLVWLWITNVALLLGAEVNAERERTIELREGYPGADKEIQLPPRSEPKDRLTS